MITVWYIYDTFIIIDIDVVVPSRSKSFILWLHTLKSCLVKQKDNAFFIRLKESVNSKLVIPPLFDTDTNFCDSLILRIGDFWYFVGTNWCDCKIRVFWTGYQFLRISESLVYLKYNIFFYHTTIYTGILHSVTRLAQN